MAEKCHLEGCDLPRRPPLPGFCRAPPFCGPEHRIAFYIKQGYSKPVPSRAWGEGDDRTVYSKAKLVFERVCGLTTCKKPFTTTSRYKEWCGSKCRIIAKALQRAEEAKNPDAIDDVLRADPIHKPAHTQAICHIAELIHLQETTPDGVTARQFADFVYRGRQGTEAAYRLFARVLDWADKFQIPYTRLYASKFKNLSVKIRLRKIDLDAWILDHPIKTEAKDGPASPLHRVLQDPELPERDSELPPI